MGRRIRVLVAIHNRILREGVCTVIEAEAELQLAAATGDVDSLLRLFEQGHPALTLIDLDLPADGGMRAIRSIRGIDPSAWLIALTTDESRECCNEARAAGVAAVVAKDLIGAMLLNIVRAGHPNEQRPAGTEAASSFKRVIPGCPR